MLETPGCRDRGRVKTQANPCFSSLEKWGLTSWHPGVRTGLSHWLDQGDVAEAVSKSSEGQSSAGSLGKPALGDPLHGRAHLPRDRGAPGSGVWASSASGEWRPQLAPWEPRKTSPLSSFQTLTVESGEK